MLQMKLSFVESFGGQETAFFSSGPDTEDVILFIHGYPDDHESWAKQIEYFSKFMSVVAIDLPGVGKSPPPQDRSAYHIDNILPRISAVIRKIGSNKKIHLVAHDWGAIISWVFASRPQYQSLIKSYTAISGPHPAMARENMKKKLLSFDPNRLEDFMRQATASYYIFMFQIPFIPELVWQIGGTSLWHSVMKSGGLPEYDSSYDYTKEEVLKRTIHPINLYRELLQGKSIETPSNIPLPVQVIIPRYDFAITPEVYDNISTYVPNLTVHSIASNHWAHRERPDTINRYLHDFVKQNSERIK